MDGEAQEVEMAEMAGYDWQNFFISKDVEITGSIDFYDTAPIVPEIATNPSIRLHAIEGGPTVPNYGGDMFPSCEDKCARENDRNRREKEYVTIDAGYLEHLLNCLANQKYMSPDLTVGKNNLQIIIDKAWNDGMEILSSKDKCSNIKVIKS